jgi:p-aminobenzoyl-glutamate transporter AbgT
MSLNVGLSSITVRELVAIAWPGVTILALVILFAVYAFIDAGLQSPRAFSSGTAEPVLGHLLLTLALLFGLFGLFSLSYGVSQIAMGSHLRQAGSLPGTSC